MFSSLFLGSPPQSGDTHAHSACMVHILAASAEGGTRHARPPRRPGGRRTRRTGRSRAGAPPSAAAPSGRRPASTPACAPAPATQCPLSTPHCNSRSAVSTHASTSGWDFRHVPSLARRTLVRCTAGRVPTLRPSNGAGCACAPWQ
jgi:hypothetical protein